MTFRVGDRVKLIGSTLEGEINHVTSCGRAAGITLPSGNYTAWLTNRLEPATPQPDRIAELFS